MQAQALSSPDDTQVNARAKITVAFSHWPRAERLLKSRHALAWSSSAFCGGGDLRALRRRDYRGAFLSELPLSLGRLAAGTELRGLSPARRPEDRDPS